MSNIRICILSPANLPVAFMDNDAEDALHYYDDTMHLYLAGAASTFDFTVDAKKDNSEYIQSGYKLAFVYEDRPYYFNIVTATEDEWEIRAQAFSLSFELINETAPAYAAASSMTFEQYVAAFGFENHALTIGRNEIASSTRTLEWESDSDTILNRLYSLATNFDAEIEFVPDLNRDFSLNTIILNIYKKHDSTHQGIGRVRTDLSLRYGINVEGISKTVDITELYSAIRPTGKDGINIRSVSAEVLDENGDVEYYTSTSTLPDLIMAPQVRTQFPSNVIKGSSRYIVLNWSTEYETVNELYGRALAKLKDISKPKTTYVIGGYIDANIGDLIVITDEEFTPALYLETRVVEQQISFTDPGKNKTSFDNTKELESQISADLQSLMKDMQKEAKAAKATANTAITTATDAQDTADTAVINAAAAQDTADTAVANAAAAQDTADTAATSAAAAQTTANAAVSSINTQQQYFWHDSSGAHVSDTASALTGNNVLIDSGSVNIKNGSDVVAKFGSTELILNGGPIPGESFTNTTRVKLHDGLASIDTNWGQFDEFSLNLKAESDETSRNSIDLDARRNGPGGSSHARLGLEADYALVGIKSHATLEADEIYIIGSTDGVCVTGHILPHTTELYDLGSQQKRFAAVYTETINADVGNITTLNMNTGDLIPSADNAFDVGDPSYKYKTAYVVTVNAITGNITAINATTGDITTINAETGNISSVNAESAKINNPSGTASTQGSSTLTVGNSAALSSASNSRGQIRLYSANSSGTNYYCGIRTGDTYSSNQNLSICHVGASSGYIPSSPNVRMVQYITSGGNKYIDFWTSATTHYLILVDVSDKRFKKNIKDSAVDALDVINAIRHHAFVWKDSGVEVPIGYVAQELEEVAENMVVRAPQEENSKYEELYQINTGNIMPYVTKAIQELSAKVDALEARVAELERKD